MGILQEVEEMQARMLQFPMPRRTGAIIRRLLLQSCGALNPQIPDPNPTQDPDIKNPTPLSPKHPWDMPVSLRTGSVADGSSSPSPAPSNSSPKNTVDVLGRRL
ncbi:unnamed protein product [Pleuronectes platessa]|uniref:Uncharacterized protein n=1 Tax=Pleuronectes platessa TaxID=8262 RepID=A0A9N7Z7H0_PLEPL|nr:unnamed protein product [Pleuronectes platessa]